MKSLTTLLALASLAVANPMIYASQSDQVPLGGYQSYPGFDLDLKAQRLVQMEGQPPVLMTELEKVRFICSQLCTSQNRMRPDRSESTGAQVF